jgi:hypothetical protein
MAGRLCDAAVREFYGERLPNKYLEVVQEPVVPPSEAPPAAAEVLPAAVRTAETGNKFANKPHFSPLLKQKSLDAVKRNAKRKEHGVSGLGAVMRELAAEESPQPVPVSSEPPTGNDYWKGERLPDLTAEEMKDLRWRCGEETELENAIRLVRIQKLNRRKYQESAT